MSYPILYKANETSFDHLGLSVLSDATKCLVTRERNGLYFLEMDYPIDGKDYKKIDLGCILKCDAGHRAKQQRFIVSKITETKEGYSKIYAKHILWERISKNALQARVSASGNAFVALEQWRSHLIDSSNDFAVWSNVTTKGAANWKVENFDNAYQVLGGKQGSILDVWGGEYEFDNLTIKLWEQMGQESSTIIAYGRNLIDLEQEKAILDTYTSVYPFALVREGEQETLLTLPEKIVDSKYVSHYLERKIFRLDLSSDESVKTVEHLRQAATNYIKANKVGVPKVHLSLSYQDLARVSSVWGNPVLDIVDLCDRVKVYFEKINIKSTNAKITKVIWDVLLDENSSIEIGDSRTSFSEAVGVKESTEDALRTAMGYVSEGFNAKLTERIKVVNRQIDAEIKKIEDSVKTGIEVAKAKAQQFKSELESKINSEIKPLANEAKQDVDRANQSIARQAEEMERLRTTLADNKREVLAEVNQTLDRQVNDFAESLTDEVNRVRFTLDQARSDIYDQANAQRELSSRVTTVEETTNGTKTTVTELQKTVNAATGNLDAVSRRTRTVEDNLSGLTTKFEGLSVGSNLIRNSKINESSNTYGFARRSVSLIAGKTYWLGARARKNGGSDDKKTRVYLIANGWKDFALLDFNEAEFVVKWHKFTAKVTEEYTIGTYWFPNGGDRSGTADIDWYMVVEGDVKPTDWQPHYGDIQSELATYKQTVDQNIAELTRTTQTVTDRVTEYKSALDQTAERFRTSLNALEAFKNDEGARESRYLSLSREETARQLREERKVLAQNYVSKSQLTETAEGIERRFERLRIGGKNLLSISKMTVGPWLRNGVPVQTTDENNFVTDFIDVSGMKQLTLSYYENQRSPSDVVVVAYDAQKQFIANIIGYKRFNAYESVTVDIPENGVYVRAKIDRAKMTRWQLESGNVRTAYSLSQDDILAFGESNLAEYKETIDERLSRLTSAVDDKVSTSTFTQKADEILSRVQALDGEVMKTSSFTINENGIVLQSGRTVNGKTFATMIAQNAENVSIIARLLRVNADMIVNGAITGRHVKANSIETGNFKGGSVTATVLAANAVTAEKMLVNQAMINKLMTDDLLARAITASELFATSVQAVDISATRVTSGILASQNGAVSFNLDGSSLTFNQNAEITFNSTNNVLYRSKDDGTFTAFLQFKDATYAEDPNGSIWATLGVTSSGDGINGLSRGRFAGIRTIRSTRGKGYHGTEYNARLKDQVEIIGDHTIIGHGANTDTGFFFEASKMPGVISMNKLYSTVVALRNMWVHFRNAGAGLQDVIKNRSSQEANADWDMMFQDLRR